LGDQLDRAMPVLDQLDPRRDRVFMAEVPAESTRVPSHQARTALVFAAMRHFAADLRARGLSVDYQRIGTHPYSTLADALAGALKAHRPEAVIGILPGDYGVMQSLDGVCRESPILWQPDTHFLSSPEEFAAFVQGRKVLRLEHWYRLLRRKTGILMDGDSPVGGEP
jgi:deoxyribodipyrimidine photolyase-related protein